MWKKPNPRTLDGLLAALFYVPMLVLFMVYADWYGLSLFLLLMLPTLVVYVLRVRPQMERIQTLSGLRHFTQCQYGAMVGIPAIQHRRAVYLSYRDVCLVSRLFLAVDHPA